MGLMDFGAGILALGVYLICTGLFWFELNDSQMALAGWAVSKVVLAIFLLVCTYLARRRNKNIQGFGRLLVHFSAAICGGIFCLECAFWNWDGGSFSNKMEATMLFFFALASFYVCTRLWRGLPIGNEWD